MKKILTLNIKQLRTEESFGYLKQVETETANRVRSGYRYGCGNLFGQPHFVIDVSPRDIAVQFFSQVAELFILIDRQLSQPQH